MTTDDYYHKWIASKAATKYRNSDKYRHSEIIAFADYNTEQQIKELVKENELLKSELKSKYKNAWQKLKGEIK